MDFLNTLEKCFGIICCIKMINIIKVNILKTVILTLKIKIVWK